MSEIDSISDEIFNWSITKSLHIYGQNITHPSYISGLGKRLAADVTLKNNPDVVFFDSTNSELTSVGYGIGRSLCGKDSLLIVKQQDFLYLALDQLINSLCNLPQDSSEQLGEFTIICLISDHPYEGTQAWANNLSIFESLPSGLNTSYCYNSLMLKESLADRSSRFRLIFLSCNYIYHSSRFSCLRKWNSNSNLLWTIHGEICPTAYVLFGFIDEGFIEDMPLESAVIIVRRLLCNDTIKAIHAYAVECNIDELVFVESSTSGYSVAKSLAIDLSLKSHVKISFVDTRNIRLNGFGLRKQSSRRCIND